MNAKSRKRLLREWIPTTMLVPYASLRLRHCPRSLFLQQTSNVSHGKPRLSLRRLTCSSVSHKICFERTNPARPCIMCIRANARCCRLEGKDAPEMRLAGNYREENLFALKLQVSGGIVIPLISRSALWCTRILIRLPNPAGNAGAQMSDQ